MSTSNPIEALWESYKKAVYDRPLGVVQNHETRRAFYAGSAAAFNLIRNQNPTREDVDTIQQELLDFANDVENGLR